MSIYDDACEYAREQGIPEDLIDDAVAQAELCCDGPYGDGCCADNTTWLIRAFAEQHQNPPRTWQCKYCGSISHDDNITPADGICYQHPAGVGNHTFRDVKNPSKL
jgi:hypothetical protein